MVGGDGQALVMKRAMVLNEVLLFFVSEFYKDVECVE